MENCSTFDQAKSFSSSGVCQIQPCSDVLSVQQMAAGVCSKGGATMKMPFQVFIAKYAYDPVAYSPNENPEAELSLNVGDYIFVYGSMDEVSYGIFSRFLHTGFFLYSALFSSSDMFNVFPGRPVEANSIITFLGSIHPCCNYCYSYTNIHQCL